MTSLRNVDLGELESMFTDGYYKDPLTELAAKIYNKSPEDITPNERKSVKNHPVHFLAMYGGAK